MIDLGRVTEREAHAILCALRRDGEDELASVLATRCAADLYPGRFRPGQLAMNDASPSLHA